MLHIFLQGPLSLLPVLTQLGAGTGKQSRAPGHHPSSKLPQMMPAGPQPAAGTAQRDGLSPGPAGAPPPGTASSRGYHHQDARKGGALARIAVSGCSAAPALAPALVLAVRARQSPLSEVRTRRKFGREGRSGWPGSTPSTALRVLLLSVSCSPDRNPCWESPELWLLTLGFFDIFVK